MSTTRGALAPTADGVRVSVTRRVRFSAARSLTSPVLDDAGNDLLFGADRRLHGREFTLHVTLVGMPPFPSGMIMDLKALAGIIKREVVAPLDRTLLNESELLGGLPPTTENLTCVIWRAIEPKVPAGTLAEISLAEGPDKRVLYRGE